MAKSKKSRAVAKVTLTAEDDVTLCGVTFVWDPLYQRWATQCTGANAHMVHSHPLGYAVTVYLSDESQIETTWYKKPEQAVAAALASILDNSTLAHADVIRSSRALREAKATLDSLNKARASFGL